MSLSSEMSQLDIAEIMELLPHRYPFLLIDRVLDYVPHKTLHAVKNITINEPIFTGHFPQAPIFPGVLILEAMAQATGLLAFKSSGKPDDSELYYFTAVDKARFRKPAVPGDVLNIHVELHKERRGIGKFTGTAMVDGQIVCEAELMCARRPIQ